MSTPFPGTETPSDTEITHPVGARSGEGYADRCWRCGDERGPHIWTDRGVQCANPESCDDRYEAKRKEQT